MCEYSWFVKVCAVPRNVIYKWSNVFPKFLSKCRVRNAFRNVKYFLDLDLTIRLTRGKDDSLDKGRSLRSLSVIETGQVALRDLARRDVCPSLY